MFPAERKGVKFKEVCYLFLNFSCPPPIMRQKILDPTVSLEELVLHVHLRMWFSVAVEELLITSGRGPASLDANVFASKEGL